MARATRFLPTFVVAGALAASGALLGVACAPPAEQPTTAGEELLRQLASRTTQGWIHEDWSYPRLERRLASGGRLFITCGTAALLARSLLADQGIPSRLVLTMTRQAFNGRDDGHTMLEVRTDKGWVLYDLNSNRMAVDRDGGPVGLAEQLAAGDDRRWRVISEDRWFNPRDPDSGEAVKGTPEPKLGEWYDRVLGVPLIESAPGSGRYLFNQTSQRDRLEAYSPFYEWVDAATWQRHVGSQA